MKGQENQRRSHGRENKASAAIGEVADELESLQLQRRWEVFLLFFFVKATHMDAVDTATRFSSFTLLHFFLHRKVIIRFFIYSWTIFPFTHVLFICLLYFSVYSCIIYPLTHPFTHASFCLCIPRKQESLPVTVASWTRPTYGVPFRADESTSAICTLVCIYIIPSVRAKKKRKKNYVHVVFK